VRDKRGKERKVAREREGGGAILEKLVSGTAERELIAEASGTVESREICFREKKRARYEPGS
jgi:hypothetical protein